MSDWWGIDHSCGGVERVYPTLHWADEPEHGAGPRRALECDACGKRYAFYEERTGWEPADLGLHRANA